MKEELCPNCNTPFEHDHISGAEGALVIVEARIEFCLECLYINHSDIKISK